MVNSFAMDGDAPYSHPAKVVPVQVPNRDLGNPGLPNQSAFTCTLKDRILEEYCGKCCLVVPTTKKAYIYGASESGVLDVVAPYKCPSCPVGLEHEHTCNITHVPMLGPNSSRSDEFLVADGPNGIKRKTSMHWTCSTHGKAREAWNYWTPGILMPDSDPADPYQWLGGAVVAVAHEGSMQGVPATEVQAELNEEGASAVHDQLTQDEGQAAEPQSPLDGGVPEVEPAGTADLAEGPGCTSAPRRHLTAKGPFFTLLHWRHIARAYCRDARPAFIAGALQDCWENLNEAAQQRLGVLDLAGDFGVEEHEVEAAIAECTELLEKAKNCWQRGRDKEFVMHHYLEEGKKIYHQHVGSMRTMKGSVRTTGHDATYKIVKQKPLNTMYQTCESMNLSKSQ